VRLPPRPTVFAPAGRTLDGERPATLDTIYDLASVTKPLATAASILTLVEQGRLTLTTALPSLFGEAATHLPGVTVHHLLTHTSGLPAWTACYRDGRRGLDAAVAVILREPTAAARTKYTYSCLNFILLARIIEIVSGQTLEVFARQNVFDPLGLSPDLGYYPDAATRERIAPTRSKETLSDADDPDALLVGKVLTATRAPSPPTRPARASAATRACSGPP
jgi:CubicO group peptidase (beta-lactamase class C family)